MLHKAPTADPVVLIIDDVASEALTVAALCHQFGYAAVRASNPDDAGRVLDMLRPAAVITDLVMPGTDGLDCLFMLAHRMPETPVMIATSSERLLLKAASELAENYGLRDIACVAKPIGAGALKAFLHRVMPPPSIPRPVMEQVS